MDNDLITKESELVAGFFKRLERMLRLINELALNYRPVLKGERYLSDKEVSERLKVSRRTLQDYRNGRKIPYYQIGGKILYWESDIEKLLEENHTKALRR